MKVQRILLEMTANGHNKFYEGWYRPLTRRAMVAWGPRVFPRTGQMQEVTHEVMVERIKQKIEKGYVVAEDWTHYEIPDETPWFSINMRRAVERRGGAVAQVEYDQEVLFPW